MVLDTALLIYLLGKIAEKVLEEAIKQSIDLAKSAVKGKIKPRISFRGGLFLPRSQLVNMERELRTIEQALFERLTNRLVYIYGEGGTGKTRLIEEAARIALNNPSALCWGGIVDFYHAEHHGPLFLQKRIVDSLDPEKLYFQEYRQLQIEWERRQSVGLVGGPHKKDLIQLEQTFIDDYNKFSSSTRIAIAFDTLEKIDDEYDVIQRLGDEFELTFTAKQWLIQFCTKIKNTTVIMAGRPSPGLQKQMEEKLSLQPGLLETIELKGLTREDTRRLLRIYAKQVRQGSSYFDPYLDILWQLTRGLPARLAMTFELGAYVSSMVSTDRPEKLTDEILKDIVGTFFDYQDPERRLLFLLALARKGMSSELLYYLQPSWTQDICQQKLDEVRKLSLIKTRPGHDDIFLHDALYEVFDNYLIIQHHADFWYRKLREFYRGKRIISAIHNRTGWKEATINSLYYGLKQDPLETFQVDYIQWSELAIRGFEIDLDMQIRDELLSFLRDQANHRNNQPTLSPDIVRLDNLVRWVKRFIFQTEYRKAIWLAEIILDAAPKEYQKMIQNAFTPVNLLREQVIKDIRDTLQLADSFFWGHLLTYYGDALIYTGTLEVYTTKILDKAISTLDKVQFARSDPLQWLKARILGHAYDRLGYLARLNGHNGKASLYYRRAISFFEHAKIEDEHANTLNNLAYALALIGDMSQANLFIDQALLLRQKIGQVYPIALSYNTRGLIRATDNPEEGVHDCRLALNMFEEIQAERGIGLACNALSHVLRQMGNRWSLSNYDSDQIQQCFQEADTFLERASEIFERVNEPARLWEAHSERGSLHHDWAIFLEREGNYEVAQQRYLLSKKYHFHALEKAAEQKMLLQQAGSYNDLAKLYASRRMMHEAEKYLDTCSNLIPSQYHYNGSNEKYLTGELYSLILGKAYFQRGSWKLHSLKYQNSDFHQQELTMKQGFEDLQVAYFYFQVYWRKGRILNSKAQDIIKTIRQSGLRLQDFRAAISMNSKQKRVRDGLLRAIENEEAK